MNQLIDKVANNESYNWKVERLISGPGVILYLVGTKKLIMVF